MVVILGGGSNKTSNITYQYAGGTAEERGLGSEDLDIHSLCQPTNVLNKIQYNMIHDKFQTATSFGTGVPSSGNLLGQRNSVMILNNVRQHNCFVIQGSYIGYMFRLIDQSSSGLFSRLSHKVLCRRWDPSVYTSVKYIKSDQLPNEV